MNASCLILANFKPNVAGRLTSKLISFGFDVFMHIDAKSDISTFQSLIHPATKIVSERINVFWGGFSMIDAVITMARAALQETNNTHFIHISDDTYPIKSELQIKKTIFSNIDLIDTRIVPKIDSRYERIRRLYLPDFGIGNLRDIGGYMNRFVDRAFIESFEKIKDAYNIKYTEDFPFKYAQGANWWCLTRNTLEKCVDIYDSRPEFTDWFRYSAHPDESFFNSCVVNFINGEEKSASPVASIWNKFPKPYEFQSIEEFFSIRKLPQIFARKFSDDSDLLLDLIDRDTTK